MKTGRIAVPLLLLALASFPACGEKKEEDKKITIQFNVAKEKEEKPQEPARPVVPPAPPTAKKGAAPDKPRPVWAEQPLKTQSARDKTSPEVEEKLRAARSALERKNPGEAIHSLNEVKRLDPDNPRLYPMLARAHQMNRDREGARAAVHEGLARNPDNAVLLYLRGFLHHREGNVQLARQDLRRALEIDPNLPMAQRARQALQDMEDGKPPRRPGGSPARS